MKKFILYFSCIMAVILLSGCSMDNTPTKKVENFLDSYRNQDETVINQLKDMVDMDNLMNEDQKNTYSDIMKRQYEDLTYEIKDEVIDGDNATVTVEIEVYDYYKVNQEAQNYYNENPNEFQDDAETDDNSDGLLEDAKEGVEDIVDDVEDTTEDAVDALTGDAKYVEYRLGKLQEAKDRVKYTIDFTLTKVDDVWTLNEIDDTTRQKIHGLYEH